MIGPAKPKRRDPCALCDKPSKSRGWCSKHLRRWERHGDPTYVMPIEDRKRRPITKPRGPARIMHPVETVAPHVRSLLDSGWTYEALAREAGVDRSTVDSVVRHEYPTVTHRVTTALLSVEPARRVWLDPTPLAVRLAARAQAWDVGMLTLLGPDAGVFRGAVERGRISEQDADRIGCRVLDLPLELIYGPDYDVEAA